MIDPDRINELARNICIELGTDPDQIIDHVRVEAMTSFERTLNSEYNLHGPNRSPRWMLYRPQAELALATLQALQKQAGTE